MLELLDDELILVRVGSLIVYFKKRDEDNVPRHNCVAFHSLSTAAQIDI